MLSYITLCTYVCPYIYLFKFLMNNFFMLFWNNDYSQGLAGHMWPVTSVVRPASAQCCWLCHLSSDGLVESKRHRSQKIYRSSEENIYRNEYYFALLYIVRQVTIPYSALQFWWNSPVFWCFEIPQMPGHKHKVACRACVWIPMYLGL